MSICILLLLPWTSAANCFSPHIYIYIMLIVLHIDINLCMPTMICSLYSCVYVYAMLIAIFPSFQVYIYLQIWRNSYYYAFFFSYICTLLATMPLNSYMYANECQLSSNFHVYIMLAIRIMLILPDCWKWFLASLENWDCISLLKRKKLTSWSTYCISYISLVFVLKKFKWANRQINSKWEKTFVSLSGKIIFCSSLIYALKSIKN